MAQKKKLKNLHGNKAKVDPKGHVESLYQSNMVTLSNRKDHETPVVDDENVEYGRRFVEENKK